MVVGCNCFCVAHMKEVKVQSQKKQLGNGNSSRLILTDTCGRLLGRPRAIGLTEALLFAHQFIPGATVMRYATSKGVTFARVVTIGRVLWLATGTS